MPYHIIQILDAGKEPINHALLNRKGRKMTYFIEKEGDFLMKLIMDFQVFSLSAALLYFNK